MQLADAKAKVAALDARVSTLQLLLAALTAVGTLLAAAIGTTAYLNLQNIQKRATQDLDDIRRDFPAISDLNRKLTRIVRQMAAGAIPKRTTRPRVPSRVTALTERGRLAVVRDDPLQRASRCSRWRRHRIREFFARQDLCQEGALLCRLVLE